MNLLIILYNKTAHSDYKHSKSRFIEMFGDLKLNSLNWNETTLKDSCTFYSGTGFPTKYQGKTDLKYPLYKVGDISRNYQNGYKYLHLCENTIDDFICKNIKGQIIPPNTVVFAKIGEALKLNRRAITIKESLVDNNAMGIYPNPNILSIEYFYQFMCDIDMQEYSSSTTVPSVKKSVLEEIRIPIAPIELQNEFSSFVEQIDKLKFVCHSKYFL